MQVKSALESGIVTKSGEEYLRSDRILMDLNPKDFYMHLDGLFGGDERLGECKCHKV
jgi:hypothetical protein